MAILCPCPATSSTIRSMSRPQDQLQTAAPEVDGDAALARQLAPRRLKFEISTNRRHGNPLYNDLNDVMFCLQL